MTCIVGFKTKSSVIIAGDRGASNEDMILNLSKPKVYQNGAYVFGYAGSMEAQKMRYTFNPPKPHEDDDIDTFMHTTFLKYLRDYYDEWGIDTSKDGEVVMLIAIKDKLYEHNASDMSLNEFSSRYVSIGTGAPYAMGYLYGASAGGLPPEKMVENAVKAAIKFSPSCSGMIDILST
jgi:20S proteasome alpha/beta subunit